MRRDRRNVFPATLLFLFCLALVSCSGAFLRNYGQIRPAGGDAAELRRGLVRPELRYYASGADLHPNALIGLHRDYRLSPQTLWKELRPLSTERLQAIVERMNVKAFEHGMLQHEFDLITPEGKRIGFWYSVLSATTYLRIADDGTVVIDTPDIDTYEKKRVEPDDSAK